MTSQGPSVPAGHDTGPRWAPVGPIAMALSAATVAASGAFLLRRPDDISQIAGPTTYGIGVVAQVIIMGRAVAARARYFAKFGMPPAWTRPPVRGVTDVGLRRWHNIIRGLRAPWPNERDTILTAARARAEGLLSIVLPAALAPLLSVVGLVLMARAPYLPLWSVALPNLLIGLVAGVVAVRYAVDGHRARAYLPRFSAPADPALPPPG